MSRLERNARRFFTTRRYPIFYLQITKCGCTYLKNLLYYLDHDHPHEAGRFIHDHSNDLIRADGRDPQVIAEARHVFTVLRNPVDRFFSLYFDKIHGAGPQNFGALRRVLAHDIGLDLAPDLTPEGHRANAEALIDWIALNLDDETPEPMNPHWKPQHLRLAKLEGFSAFRMTLDGLDWQLPWFLRGVVPTIENAMAAVKERNVSVRAQLQESVLTPALRARIREVYAQDTENYETARARWAKRQKRATRVPPAPQPPLLRVLSTHRYPINFRIIPKCGSTLLRNLAYRLDHGTNHPDPQRIDADGALYTPTKERAHMGDELNIVVFREPFQRLMSLYFNKVWGEGETAFPWISRTLSKNRRFNMNRDIDEAAHHDNLMRLIGLLETRFAQQRAQELNPHWRPQSFRLSDLSAAGFKPLLLEDLDRQLPLVARARVPGIKEELASAPGRNKTDPPVPYDRFRTPYILERLEALYAEDIALYERLRTQWGAGDTCPAL